MMHPDSNLIWDKRQFERTYRTVSVRPEVDIPARRCTLTNALWRLSRSMNQLDGLLASHEWRS